MDSIVLHSGSVFDLPSRFSFNKQLKFGKPLISIKGGTALICGSAKDDEVHSSVPITNSDTRNKVADTRKHEEILALLRRIRSSIAEDEAANLQIRKAVLSNEPSVQLKDAIAKKEEKKVGRRKQPVAKKDQKVQNDGPNPALDFKATRLHSSFSKRSPIPSWTAPGGTNSPGGDDEASMLSSINDLKEKLKIDGQSSELDFRASRLPSRFLKRSPIPSLAKPKEHNPLVQKDETSPYSGNNNLKEMKLAELKKLAKTRGIKGYSKLKKSEILELLSK